MARRAKCICGRGWSQDLPVDDANHRAIEMTDRELGQTRNLNGKGFLIGPIDLTERRSSAPECQVWCGEEGEGSPITVYNDPDVLSACFGALDRRYLSRWGKEEAVIWPRLTRDLLKRPEVAQNLSGTFAIACVDKKAHRTIFLTDKSGIQGIYYAFDGKSLVLSTNLMWLLLALGHSGEPDEFACFLHFAFGYTVFTNQTLYKGVKRVSAASRVVADADGVKERRYWFPPEMAQVLDYDAEELAQCIGECIDKSLGPSWRPFLGLTSGKDSLCLLAAATRYGLHPLTGTFGSEGCADRVQARDIAARLHLEHVEAGLCSLADFGDECSEIALYSGGLATASYVDMCCFVRNSIPPGYAYVMGEGGGEPSGLLQP